MTREARRRLTLAWRALRHGDPRPPRTAETVRVSRDELLEVAHLAILASGLRPFDPLRNWAELATTQEIEQVERVAAVLRDARAGEWQDFERGLAPQEVK
jgi:hypothetical protein